MPYEYLKNTKVDEGQIIQNPFREIEFDYPYVCDGCDERCVLSVNLRVEPTRARFVGDDKSMLFRVEPEMCAGDKKLFEFPVNRPNVYYPRGSNLSVLYLLGASVLRLDEVLIGIKVRWCGAEKHVGTVGCDSIKNPADAGFFI